MTARDLERSALAALAELLECGLEEQRARLAELSAADPALGARVRRLLGLATARELEPRLAESDLGDLLESLERRTSGLCGLAAGDLIGPFRLAARLGLGGMGEVWRAQREGVDFQQTVAVKVLRLGLEAPELVRRFQLERQLLAGLDHPAIPRLIDGGTTPDGRPYLAMEFVEGEPIDKFVSRQKLGLRPLLELFVQICEGVEHAHRRGIVHRDLKPDNILVDQAGRPRVLDFGIAKLIADSEGALSELMTRTGERVLTLRYASPEQLAGGPLTPAVDIHALGLVLFELLTGRSPFAAGGGTPRELEQEILERIPPPPSQHLAAPFAADRRQVRGDVDVICAVALRKDPRRRYASAGLLAADLARHLAGEPIAARRDSFLYRMGRAIVRNRALVGGASATFLTLLAGVVVSRFQYLEARRASEHSERLAYVATMDAVEASVRSGSVATMADRLGALDPGRRGWEWRHLSWRVDRSETFLPFGYGGGRRLRGKLAVGGGGRWLACSDQCDLLLHGGPGREFRLAFDALPVFAAGPRSDLLFVAAGTGAIARGEVRPDLTVELQPWVTVEGPQPAGGLLVLDLCLCPQEKWLAATLINGEVLLFDSLSGAIAGRWAAHEPSATGGEIAWSPDGSVFVTAGWDESVQHFEPSPARHRGGFRAHSMWVTGLAFAPDGGTLATCSLDRDLALWDTRDWSLRLRRTQGHTPSGLVFDGRGRLYLGESSGAVRALDPADGATDGLWLGGVGPIARVCLWGERLAALDLTSGVRLFDGQPWDVPSRRICEYAGALACSPDSDAIVVGSPDQRTRVLELPNLALRGELPLEEGYVLSVAWSPDGRWIATAHLHGVFALWSAADLSLRHRWASPDGGQAAAVGFTADSRHLRAVGTRAAHEPGHVWTFDVVEGTLRGAQRVPRVDPERTHLVPEAGPTPALLCTASALFRLDRESAAEALPLPGPLLQLSAQAGFLWTLSADSITAWERPGPAPSRTLPLERASHACLAAHPHGDRLALGTETRIDILDSRDGGRLMSLHGHGGEVYRLLWTPDGTTLISLGLEGDVKVWRTP